MHFTDVIKLKMDDMNSDGPEGTRLTALGKDDILYFELLIKCLSVMKLVKEKVFTLPAVSRKRIQIWFDPAICYWCFESWSINL